METVCEMTCQDSVAWGWAKLSECLYREKETCSLMINIF